MTINDDSPFKEESKTISDVQLDAGILRLKAKGISTVGLEGVREQRRAAKKKEEGAGVSGCQAGSSAIVSSAGSSRIAPKFARKTKCELDSDPETDDLEEKLAALKKRGTAFSALMKERAERFGDYSKGGKGGGGFGSYEGFQM